jgi:hypothetical protein
VTAPPVTVVGGGIAGLTAGLRLAERGYPVTVYERQPIAGGNLASNGEFDVYPHMYLTWYHNLWALLADVGVDRESGFRPLRSIRQLRRGDFPHFGALTDMYARSLRKMLGNLFSGVGSPADLEVFGYGSTDLLAERMQPTMSLSDISVTGFMQARPYMTDGAVEAFDAFITRVWAIPGYLASAEDYRTYLDYCTNDPLPSFFLPRGSAGAIVVEPVVSALRAHGVDLQLGVGVDAVHCAGGRVTSLTLSTGTSVPVSELVLAVPPAALLALIRNGQPGARMVDVAPALAQVSRLRTQSIPLVNLCFTRKRRGFPPEPVGLLGSTLNLAFTDISQTWSSPDWFAKQTVLAVSASDPAGLPGTGPEDDAMAILRELAEYVDFDPGTAWRDSPEIDWTRTRYFPNDESQLFVNEIGSDPWRPKCAVAGLANIALAGDHCENRIGMTTIEAAVTTGLEAARAIVERHGFGAPVEISEPKSRMGADYVVLRYLWAPYAAAAWSWATATKRAAVAGTVVRDLERLARHLLAPTPR